MGSGKGYLSSFLSLQYGLRVYGIDSSSTNTHGAQERNRKLKKFSRAYQKHSKAVRAQGEASHPPEEELVEIKPGTNGGEDVVCGDGAGVASREEEKVLIGLSDVNPAAERHSEPNPEPEELFLSALSVDVTHTTSPRVPPSQLSIEERERRKRENLERKAQNRTDGAASTVFSPLTSYVTAETELRELINELEVSKPKVLKIDLLCVWAKAAAAAEQRGGEYSVVVAKQSLSQQLEFALLEQVWGVPAVPNLQCVIINKFSHRSPPLPLSSVLSFLCVPSPKFQDAVMVGLHTCGDLAPSTLRMFVAKPELAAVCSVGCCYHLLSEEFDPAGQGNHTHTMAVTHSDTDHSQRQIRVFVSVSLCVKKL